MNGDIFSRAEVTITVKNPSKSVEVTIRADDLTAAQLVRETVEDLFNRIARQRAA